MMEADNTSNPICTQSVTHMHGVTGKLHTIQVSLRRFTSHLVICPAACITNKLQKPSASWKNGVEYLRSLSQVPIVIISRRPPEPNIHSFTLESCALLPSNVLATQSPLAFASTANRFILHINKPGMSNHCAIPMILTSAHLIRELSGVASLIVE